MTPKEALDMALTKEKTSVELYKELSKKHPDIKELLLQLLNEEEKHCQMIEKKIYEITRY